MSNISEDQIPSDLISISKAAKRLDISPRSVRRNFVLVKIGGRSLVRVEDIKAKIEGGRSDVLAQ